MTALTLYAVLNSATATLTTATSLITASGGFDATSVATEVDAATGYGEMYSLSHVGAWPAGGSIGIPSGHGFLYDSTALEGQTLQAGTYTCTTTWGADATAVVVTLYLRVYKRSSGGVYTSVGVLSVAGTTVNGIGGTVISPSGTLSSMAFATGDKLYIDTWWNITSNNGSNGLSGYMKGPNASPGDDSWKIVTPGFAPTPSHAGVADGMGGVFS